MSHTDPQNDIPCTACEAEGSRSRLDDDGLCPDCRTPAGRLVAALLAAGIEDVNHDSSITVSVGCLTIEVYEDDPERWTIEGFDADGITAIDAIAAIVQAPGLRAERDTLAARVAELEAHNGRMVAAWLHIAERADTSLDNLLTWCHRVASALPGHDWEDVPRAVRALASGAS